MPARKRKPQISARPLGPLEQRVMDVLWERTHATVADVVDALRSQTDSAYTTIMTVMSRLVEKGLLEREAEGRAYVYRAAHTRAAFEEELSRLRVRDLIAEFGDVAISQFAEELQSTDPARARRLGDLLRRRGGDTR